MSLFRLDTDILSLLEEGNPQAWQHVEQHPPIEIAVSTISLQEQMQGFLAAVHRARDTGVAAFGGRRAFTGDGGRSRRPGRSAVSRPP